MKQFWLIVSVVLGLYGFFMEEAQAAEKREPLKAVSYTHLRAHET